MSQPKTRAGREPRLLSTLRADFEHVTADMRKRGIGREVGGTLTGLEAFYLDDEARERLAGMKPVGRFFRRALWLIHSLLMKLTPARRVLLAIGLFFVIFGVNHIGYRTFQFDLRMPLVGDLLVLFVLMLELKDKLVARHELEDGRAVQFALMPEPGPAVPGWEIWLYTRPANDVGGDLVDHLQIDDGHHGVALGDVAGKALPAALLMVKLQATLRALVPEYPRLDALGAAMNRILHRDGLPNRFATLVYLVLAVDSGDVRLLNAGHMPPLVVRGRTIEELRRGSMALGMLPDAVYEEQQVHLDNGDVAVVFSDGVVEAFNASDEFFGDDRLRSAIAQSAGQSVEQIGRRILQDIDAFVGEAPTHDDISLVIVKRRAA